MKPSSELFKLIKALSKSEKRFFKLSSSLQSGEKNYLKLFDAIEAQTEYDEEEIKEMFKNETFIKHLPSEKNHLYKLILKSLRQYSSESSIGSVLQEEIKNIEILYKKGLYKEGAKIIKKAKKLAYKHERFYYLFELIKWEKIYLEEEYQAGNFDKNLDELNKEESDILDKLRNLAEYMMLYSKINYVFRRGGYIRNDLERQIVSEIENYHLIKGKNTAKSRRAAATCYYIQGLCAIVNNEYKKSYEKFNRVIAIFQENPVLLQEIPKQYIRSLNNLLMCYLDKKDYKAFNELIEEMKELKKQPEFTSAGISQAIDSSIYSAELIALDLQAEYEKGLDKVNEIIDWLEDKKETISKEEEIVFYYNIAYIYFGNSDYKNALKWLNKVINDNEVNLRQDIFSFSRLFSIVVHYELENYDLLDYLTKSYIRFYQKRKKETAREHAFELAFLTNMKKIAKYQFNEKKRMQLFENLKSEINNILKNSYERVALKYFDYPVWIESKIKNVSYAELHKSNKNIIPIEIQPAQV